MLFLTGKLQKQRQLCITNTAYHSWYGNKCNTFVDWLKSI